jgi:hypothetical protein
MSKFVVFIGKLLFITLLSAVLLDIAYTLVYLNSTQRNKIQHVLTAKDKKFDVLFMGSSRTQNHMVAKVFNDKGIKAFNFGMSGSKLDETALLLKLMLENEYKIKNIILDVDLNLNSNSYSDGVRSMYMPYLHTSKTIQQHYQNIPEYNQLFYIPFYRYIKNDAKIGFREMFFSLVNKKTNALNNDGFYAIKMLCQKNNINLIAIATPMCQGSDSDAYFNRIKSVYPEVYNYENKVTDDRYFSSCGHLNEKGATVFTTIILNDFIQNKFH